MARPKLSLKRPVSHETLPAQVEESEVELLPEMPAIPPDWQKGALLNVRGTAEGYSVTLHPEEDDWRHPERTLRFTNTGMCQDFVSRWYSRENADPRAR